MTRWMVTGHVSPPIFGLTCLAPVHESVLTTNSDRRDDLLESLTSKHSSLKERGLVKGGPELGFSGCGGYVGACVIGVSCFPVAAMSVASGRAGQGPGGARPRSGAAGVLEVTGREPDDLAAGNGSRGSLLVFGCVGSSHVPGHPVAGQCRWLHSSLRVSPAVAGGHGAGPRQRGQAGPITGAPCRLGAEGRIASGLAPGGGENAWRPRAWSGVRLFMPPAPSG